MALTKRPTGKVASMSAPTRKSDGTLFVQTKWRYPAAVVNRKSNNYATFVKIRTLIEGKADGKAWKLVQDVTAAGLVTEMTRNLGAFVVGGKTYNRNDFYPYTNRKIDLYWTHVKLCNNKGEGPWQSTKRQFTKPRKPTITEIHQDAQSGNCTCTIDTNPGNDHAERRTTEYTVEIYNGITDRHYIDKYSSTSTSINITRDFTFRTQLDYNEYGRMTVRARAQGFAGDSDWVERNYYISWPPLPVITKVDAPSKSTDAKVTVYIKLKANDSGKTDEENNNFNTQHPVTGCKLEVLRNTEAATQDEATASDEWQPMNYQDNGKCEALTASVADLVPSRGLHTWVRIKSWNDIEDIFYRYSEPMEVVQLYQAPPTQSESEVVVLSVISGDDGKSAIATLGWNASGQDTMTGTEVSWSENANAWRSTAGPSTHDFTWSDGELVDGSTTYHDSAVLHIAGLTEGTLYHVRARRYEDRESGDRLYGDYYGTDMTAIPATSPSSVSLSAAGSVADGRPLEVTWSYDSESMQTAYQLITGPTVTRTDSEGNDTLWISDTGALVLASGTDSRGSYVIAADTLAEHATNGVIALAVMVSTGGAYVVSQAALVGIEQPPVAGIVMADVTQQPASVQLTSSVQTARAMLSVTAQGADGSLPDGSVAQVGGDAVWAASLVPEWTAISGGSGYEATVTMPDNLTLYDGAGYTVTVTLADTTTGLYSDPASADFEVEWEHQAPSPSDDITVTASDVTDADGIRTISATIGLVAPDGAEATDVYDVYRVLDDEVQLIADSRELDSDVVDLYAPFGNRTLSYRVACRTVDGDVDWDDYGYQLLPRDVTDGLMMRIDFGSQYIELDRGVSYSDRRKKSFVGRSHMGDMTQRGYWGDEIQRDGQSSAAAIMVYEQEQIALMDALAVHRGPCFVRMSTGVAFVADVQVDSANASVGSAGMQYSLAITKVALTDDYTAVPVETIEGGD